MSTAPVLVACCGNRTRGDDAAGLLVADVLRETPDPRVEVADLGMDPSALLNMLENRHALVVADAARWDGAEPGDVLEFDWPDIDAVREARLSGHGLSLLDHLDLAGRLGLLPPATHVVAVAIERAEAGESASAAVVEGADEAAERIRRWVARHVA